MEEEEEEEEEEGIRERKILNITVLVELLNL
jgi:hypothetical protein